MNIKKGYKRLKLDMTSRYGDMQYELNVPYHLNGELVICNNGYHLCKNMLDTVLFYDSEDSKLFEVEYNADNCIETKNKLCSDYIKIIREIPIEEYHNYIKEYVKNNDITNEDWITRSEVAKQGFCLDILINDKKSSVRYEVAKQGYGLDKLINDEDRSVRCEIVKQGYGLDKLINDEDYYVRSKVAKQGYGLDVLINDKDYYVRCEVAKQGFGLDILVDDKDFDVKNIARQKLKELNNK